MTCWRNWRPLRQSLVCCGLTALALTSGGCSRTFWRKQADADSYQAITERITDPRWAVPRFDLGPDPRSRFYDPSDPDCAPLPPDDPAAHVYMHWVDGWQGYKGWHKLGDLMTVENPQWLANFGLSPERQDPLSGEYVSPVPALYDVTLQQAVELSQLHNRDYQFQIEQVYLQALAVTFERFRFSVRYLGIGGSEPGAAVTSTWVPHGPGDRVTGSVGAGISQVLPAGTQWAMEIANNTIWLFGGGSQTSTMSSLSFQIVQPLLATAGRKFGLEGLTQTERNLLYETRRLARFRQELFTQVVGGGFGFLSLLQQFQAIRNEYGNIERLEKQVERLLAESKRNELFANALLPEPPPGLVIPPEFEGRLRYLPDLGLLYWGSNQPIQDAEIAALRNLSDDPRFQVAVAELVQKLRTEVATLDVLQLQSNLTNSINRVRAFERALQDDLDSFKVFLGLPPDMEFTIDDSLLAPFEIIDPQLSELETLGNDFVFEWGQINDDDPDLSQLRITVDKLSILVGQVLSQGLDVVTSDLRKVEAALPRRMTELKEPVDQQLLRSDFNRARLLYEAAAATAANIRESVDGLQKMLTGPNPDLQTRLEVYRGISYLREDLVSLVQNLTVVQVSLRVELIEVQQFDMAMQTTIELALENRVDLMNARALVMDARRKVEIAANLLKSNLDVVVAGDLNTPTGTRPFDIRGSESNFRAGLRFTAPLDQIDERNAYRTTLINYQRERRSYMLFEDQVKQSVRVAWRQLFVLRQNLETSRRAVRLAALQFDSAVTDSNDPDARSTASSTTTRSRSGSGVQGNNLLNALNAILTAQNQLIQNWINYERNRLNIYRDMGIMEVGEDGLWNDPLYRSGADDNNSPNRRPEFLDLDLPGDPDGGWGRLDGDDEADLVAFPFLGELRE